MINNKTERLVIAGLFLALAILVPQLFHVFPVANTGGVLLPMHIPVILCGIIAGPLYGIVVGALSPFFSFLLTGMPTAVRLPFMVCELMIYGFSAGVMYKVLLGINKVIRVYATLIISMICGRISYLISLFVAINIFNVKKLSMMAVIDALILGIPGIILQLALIPAIVFTMDKAVSGRSKSLLRNSHTFVCRNGGKVITSDKKGIVPIMDILRENPDDLKGAKISDRVIGKAAALLLIKGGVSTLYTEVISSHALKVLKKNSNIRVSYGKKVPYIINRAGDGMCPMESATLDIDNPDKAYEVLLEKLNEMKKKSTNV